jgi:eukaryotic translation initiation factor 2C
MYLPAEVCIVVPGQPSKAKLDSSQTQQMIRHAVRKPWENARSILQDGVGTVGLDENSNILLTSFRLEINPGLVKVPGRVLSGPRVVYKNNQTADPCFGSWNMMNIKFNSGARLKRWSCAMISFPRSCDVFDQQGFAAVTAEFHQALKKVGIEAAPPIGNQRLVLQHLDDPALGPFLETAAGSLELLVIVLPEANIPLYKRIKTICDKDLGLHSICSVGSKLAKDRGRDQYMANVALKINLKLGGTNQIIEPKNLSIIDQDKTMVVGIDVTHPSPGSSHHAPSVSAMVASIDKRLGQWPATLRIQRARQENVDDLAEMLKSRLALWKSPHGGKHAAFPENILIYRDGVSEGQYDTVLSQELPQLRKACQDVYPAPDTKKGLPRFTVVICGKRHKTRFYPTTEQDCDRSGNTKPGTVVDRGVTEARNWDFFLQAHAALQGTARPCHYYIVHDEIFRQLYAKTIPPPYQNIADIVEDLTHNMCYLFGRANKAVSLCPPAYYADLACERARCYLANLFDTPNQSAAPSTAAASAAGGAGGVPAHDSDVQIHARIRDTMFYI